MARRTVPDVERLEGRALLSSLSYSLTTDQPTYQVGQPIELTFTETNVSDQPVTVEVSPTDFTIAENNSAIWQSDPANAGQSPTSETLLSGQSISQTASWDGMIPEQLGSPPTTTTDAFNNFGTFTVSNPNGPQGMNATFQITDPLAYTLTTDQSVYQLGQTIQISITETNTSDQTVWLPSWDISEVNILYKGTSVIADTLQLWAPPFSSPIDAGQALTTSFTWNGIPGYHPNYLAGTDYLPEPVAYSQGYPTGNFVVEYDPPFVPTPLSTTFEITPPSQDDLITSVTTDQPIYNPGQPVTLVFTETNAGNQPVPIIIGTPEFQVMQNGTIIWETTWNWADPNTESWSTLQPGQSYSQTVTWDGIPNQGSAGNPTGVFTVSDNFDPNADVATFQISSQATTSGQNLTGSSTPDVVATLSTDRGRYKIGESVRIALTLKDASAKHIALKASKNVAQITVLEGLTEVYESSRTLRAFTPIKHGQTVKLTTTWSGKANQPGIKKLIPGTYTIQVDDDGYLASKTVRISSSHGRAQARAVPTAVDRSTGFLHH